MEWGNVKWLELFSIGMLFVTLALPMFFLIQAFRRHHMDDLDCSKFEVFSSESGPGDVDFAPVPAVCQPGYLRPWAHAVNVQWIWVTLGIGAVWGLIMLGAFVAARGFDVLRNSAAV